MTKEYRVSNYERAENDQYFTEPWCSRIILKYLPSSEVIRVWEPSAGRGDMVRVLVEEGGFLVTASDIDMGSFDRSIKCTKLERDFFSYTKAATGIDAIVTNPPYGDLAEPFIRHALSMDVKYVAMLLRVDWDSAGTRVDLFQNNEYGFLRKIVLLSRPRWDWWKEPVEGEVRKSPMHNYAWFLWRKQKAAHTMGLEPSICWERKGA